MDSKKLFMMI